MLNQAPIFLSGFARGGTTILMNLIASHPSVCTIGETHQVFKGRSVTDTPWRVLHRCLFYEMPVLAAVRQDLFSPRLYRPRKKVPRAAQVFIDRVLYGEKLRSRHEQYNLLKAPGVKYTLREIAESRLVAKNLNGTVFLNDMFATMYPDAQFVCLVRNGLAVCEGQVRRGKSARTVGQRYRMLAAKMIADSKQRSNSVLIRFEDILDNPVRELRQLYARLHLDVFQVLHVRMQLRKKLDAEGRHRVEGGSEWDVVWCKLNDLEMHLDRGINRRQVGRLRPGDRDAFLREAGEVMEQLGYATDRAA